MEKIYPHPFFPDTVFIVIDNGSHITIQKEVAFKKGVYMNLDKEVLRSILRDFYGENNV